MPKYIYTGKQIQTLSNTNTKCWLGVWWQPSTLVLYNIVWQIQIQIYLYSEIQIQIYRYINNEIQIQIYVYIYSEIQIQIYLYIVEYKYKHFLIQIQNVDRCSHSHSTKQYYKN